MDTLHQLWIGGSLPERNRPWCDSMRTLASGLGCSYRLDGWQFILEHYTGNPVLPILQELLDFLPVGTAASLISDWFRLRVLADEGGLYADTDFSANSVPVWRPSADLALFHERMREDRLATGFTWCNGERGRAACKLMVDAVETRLLEMLGSPADYRFRAHAVELLRMDRPGTAGMSLVHFIGPAYARKVLLPMLAAHGYTTEGVPREVAFNWHQRHFLPGTAKPAVWHFGFATWRSKDGWAALAKAAQEHGQDLQRRQEAMDAQEGTRSALLALPAHLRPQGVAKLPERPCRKPVQPAPLPAVQPVEKPGADVLATITVPRGVRRIVVFSNVTAGFPDFPLQPGDWCIHINTGRHIDAALQQRGTKHALFVRHGKNPKTKRRCWYTPPSFEGMEQVVFINDGMPAQRLPWWRQYLADNPGRCPTSGWIVANLLRTLAPRVPLFLLGFDPAEKHGTPRWKGHAWDYEAAWYADKKFNVIKPTT